MKETCFGPGPGSPFEAEAVAPRSAARVEDGAVRHLAAHLDRLALAARAQERPAPWLLDHLGDLARWVGAEVPTGAWALRLQLRDGALLARIEAIPGTREPYRLQLRPHPLGSPGSVPLARHKGLTGAWGAASARAAREAGFSDALLHWEDGTLVETGIASIALERGGELFLPPPDGRVASLAERLDLPSWARHRGLVPVTRAFRAGDLAGGRLWCFNALRGFWAAMPE